MKKSLSVIFSILMIFTAFLLSVIFGFYKSSLSINTNNTSLFINSISIANKNKFYTEIKRAVDVDNLNIYKIEYPNTNNHKSKVVLYAYINDESKFYENLSLRSGRYLTKYDSDDCYLSSNPDNDENCVGVLNWFDGTSEMEVRPISASKNDLMDGIYNIQTKDNNLIDSVTNQLKEDNKFDVTISKRNQTITLTDGLMSKYILTVVLFFVVIGIGICSVILYIYILVYKFKEFSVKKINGYDDKKIIVNNLRFVLKSYIVSYIISFIIITITLLLYNHLSYYIEFMLILTLILLAVFVVIFAVVSVITPIFIKKIHISNMLKNKKPLRLIGAINSISKVMLSICSVAVLSILIQNSVTLYSQTSDLKKWEFTKGYAFLRLYLANFEDENVHSEFLKKCHKFFKITNKNDGLLMKASDALSQPGFKGKYCQGRPEWEEYTNGVSINNNYLKRYPIYDINDNRVLFDNEDDNTINVLIPQKYQYDNENIQEYYQKKVDFILRCFDNNRPSSLNLNIVYVKDNQNYFFISHTFGFESGVNYTDPVAIVYNNVSMPDSSASGFITQGYYYAKIDDTNNPIESLKGPLKESGLDEHLITAPSLYTYVSTEFYNNARLVCLYSVLAIVSLLMFIVIILVSITNYMDNNKLILAIEKIHGFSFINRHLIVYLKSLVMWAVLFIIANAFFFNYYSQYITLALALMDIVVKTLVIKLKELKNTKDLLKGE